MINNIRLDEPDIQLKEGFQNMVREYEASDEKFYYEIYKHGLTDFEAYIKKLKEFAEGVNIPSDWVPMRSYWLVNEANKVLGVLRIRTTLESEDVAKYYGNIGYDICPSERGRGNGKRILALGLEKAKEIGLKRVLITCNRENNKSARIIEGNGGIFESEIFHEEDNEYLRRYWIEII